MFDMESINGHGQRTGTTKSGWNLYSYVQNNPMMFKDPYGYGKVSETSGINLDTIPCYNCVKSPKEQCEEMGCKYNENTKVCDCGSLVIVYGEYPGTIPLPTGWDILAGPFWEEKNPNESFEGWASQPSMHDIKENILYYLKPDKKYKECQMQYLMCLAGGLLPFNPYSSSTYVSQALQEISEDYEDKAFDYFIKNLNRLKQPQKSKYVWGPAKTARIMGKASILSNIVLTGGQCVLQMKQCLLK